MSGCRMWAHAHGRVHVVAQAFEVGEGQGVALWLNSNSDVCWIVSWLHLASVYSGEIAPSEPRLMGGTFLSS